MYGGSDFQGNNIEKQPISLLFNLFEIAWVKIYFWLG